ncbi:MAG TPA: lmo0937 family membrane protein [Chloroflexota bacterium]|nr:lmo0937 family membrane protein [Chloroflexota bacterium]
MANLLWIVVAILLIFWLLGLTAFHLGTIVWLLLVLAIVAAIISVFSGGYFRT